MATPGRIAKSARIRRMPTPDSIGCRLFMQCFVPDPSAHHKPSHSPIRLRISETANYSQRAKTRQTTLQEINRQRPIDRRLRKKCRKTPEFAI
jgi:hypothetical protein